jgi:hypothetical protein
MRRPQTQSGAGIGVDTYGGPAIDPTENVLALVDAESRRQDGLRHANERFEAAARQAETRRLNDLETQRVRYETIIETMRGAQAFSTSTLLATQLKEVKENISERVAKLEQFRWESGGKTTARGDVWGYIVGAASLAVAITVVVTFLISHKP